MLIKLLLVSLVVAVTLAAPQYPINYPFPFYNPFLPSPYPVRPLVAKPSAYALPPYPHVYPSSLNFNIHSPIFEPFTYKSSPYTAADPAMANPDPMMMLKSPTPSAAAPAVNMPKPVVPEDPTSDYSDLATEEIERRVTIRMAEMLMTPEQKREFEELVARFNPLEYGEKLKETGSHEEAIRLFKH